MNKEAQIMDALGNAGTSIMDKLKGAPDKISEFWNGLSSTQRSAITNSLAGAAAGGLGSGLLGGDKSDNILAALLGGSAGAGLTLGGNALFGDSKLPSEGDNKPGIFGRVAGGLGDAAASNPLAVALGGLGAAGGIRYGGMPGSSAATEAGVSDWVNAMGDQAKKKSINLSHMTGKAGDKILASELLESLKSNDPRLKGRSIKDVIESLKGAVSGSGSAGSKAKALAGQALNSKNYQLGNRGVLERALKGSGASKYLPNRLAWMAAPLGLGAGMVADKYIQGEV